MSFNCSENDSLAPASILANRVTIPPKNFSRTDLSADCAFSISSTIALPSVSFKRSSNFPSPPDKIVFTSALSCIRASTYSARAF